MVKTSNEESQKTWFPPANAIANGNWIGDLPSEFQKYTRSDEQCLALMQACIYLATIVGNKPAKSICSHGYIIKNPDAIINSIPKDITGVVRMTLVGAFTPTAEAAASQRFELNHQTNKRFLNEHLLVKNIKYIEHEHLVNRDGFHALDTENMQVVNRLDSGNNPVNQKLIRIMEFSHTSHHNDTGRIDIKDIAQEKEQVSTGDIQNVEVEPELENQKMEDDEDMTITTRTRIHFTPPDVYSSCKMMQVITFVA
jgi:hypothetical protein